jgi:integrase
MAVLPPRSPWRWAAQVLASAGAQPASLPGLSLVLAAPADSSQRSFADWIRRIASWGFQLPCSPVTVLALLERCRWDRETPYAPTTIRNILSAVARFHRLLGLPDPTKHFLVRQAVAGYGVLHKVDVVSVMGSAASAALDPWDPEAVRAAAQAADTSRRCQALDWRVISVLLRSQSASPTCSEAQALAVLTGFFLGLRPGSLASLRICDVSFDQVGAVVRITIPVEKTERRRAGPPRSLLWTGAWRSSPWLSRLHAFVLSRRRDVGTGPSSPLFVTSRGGPLSLDAVRVAVRAALDLAVQLSSPGYVRQSAAVVSGASLRSGACSAARLLGFSVRQVAFLFNWRTPNMIHTYSRLEAGTGVPDSCVAGEFARLMDAPELARVTPPAPAPLRAVTFAQAVAGLGTTTIGSNNRNLSS